MSDHLLEAIRRAYFSVSSVRICSTHNNKPMTVQSY
jgi:hypothetical protein